eukprot:TRINITY_DN53019_c0_g1_i1.p1 TRINITY_DN53019_c0_g1~~TRINITY_DN53019_c0_g1_i1.p1  ORF type:complete len:305 (+),score=22.51 TRINITY_DN53019_c0_g1_i1:74-988(+)
MLSLRAYFRLCIAGVGCCILRIAWTSYGLPKEAEHHNWPQIHESFHGKLPIEWVHVPKAGQSFLNTLIHIPGVCPGLPEDLIISVESTGGYPRGGGLPRLAKRFEEMYKPALTCNRSTWDLRRIRHEGINAVPGFNAGKGRFMAFFRQPEQRLLSDVYYSRQVTGGHGLTLEEALVSRSGLQTKILTRSDPFTPLPPSRAEVEEAKLRLQTGFSFIGLTEKWKLSICLFNTMFNQACRSLQFANLHRTHGKTSSTYDITQLKGWRDPYDTELYNIAVKMFEASLTKHNVNESSCEPCWRQAGVT